MIAAGHGDDDTGGAGSAEQMEVDTTSSSEANAGGILEQVQELRVQPRQMISWREPEGQERGLAWGEFFVPNDFVDNDDDEEEDDEDEEAEEIDSYGNYDNSEIDLEPEEGRDNITEISDEDTANAAPDAPAALIAMPDVVLEQICHYATQVPTEVLIIERVCKRLYTMLTEDGFWARHVLFRTVEDTISYPPLPEGTTEQGEMTYYIISPWTETIREKNLYVQSFRKIRAHNDKGSNARNEILSILGGADNFRTVSADLISKMMQEGSEEARFRLRGDSVGYLAEIVQGYTIAKLEDALMMALHRKDAYSEVKRKDIIALDRMSRNNHEWHSYSNLSYRDRSSARCSVGLKYHGASSSYIDCSCSCPSSDQTIWKWPDDDCSGVLPAEASRKIIRKLAYCAGIVRISSEAFLLVEAELLHTMAVLLIDAYESSKAMAKKASYLDAGDDVSYGTQYTEYNAAIDIFSVPPPPQYVDNAEYGYYTIVPGQIRAAAERRSIVPYHVYGDTWVPSTGSTVDEEKEIEEGYYYKAHDAESDSESDAGDSRKLLASGLDQDEKSDDDMEYEYQHMAEEEQSDDCTLDLNHFDTESHPNVKMLGSFASMS